MSIVDAALPLQKLILDTLKSDQAVTAIVGQRVYDHVPRNVVFPFIQIGDDSFNYSRLSIRSESTIRVYTQSVGMPQVKTLGSAVLNSLISLDDPVMAEGLALSDVQAISAEYLSDETAEAQLGEIVVAFEIEADTSIL